MLFMNRLEFRGFFVRTFKPDKSMVSFYKSAS